MKDNFIRTIYLYLFTLVGLAVLVIGLGRLVDLGLKVFVFKNADGYENSYDMRPMPMLLFDENAKQVEEIQACGETCNLSKSQIAAIDSWLLDYQEWKDSGDDEKIDYRRQSRERQASGAISQIIVGLPLYLYHWIVIKRDRKRKV